MAFLCSKHIKQAILDHRGSVSGLRFFKINECQSNMPQPSCMCTVLLKLAKFERLKIRNFWVHVLFILKRWQAAIDCDLPHLDSVHDFYTLMVVSANFQRSLGQTMIILFIHGVSRSLPLNLSLHLFKTCQHFIHLTRKQRMLI